MRKIHVVMKKEELDGERLNGKVLIVLDILFATTTIVSALDDGVAEVWPALNGEAARQLAQSDRFANAPVLAGELYAETLDGFAPASPLALAPRLRDAQALVYATTNGTVALTLSQSASHVYVGALRNAQAVVEHVVRHHPQDTIMIVCSGSADRFNLEDFYGAGYFVKLFREAGANDFTDAAKAAELTHQAIDARACFELTRVGQRMLDKQLSQELDFAAAKDVSRSVPKLQDGVIRLLAQN